jgi:hypothetical protein
MHYMHCYTGYHFGSQQVCIKWFHTKICMFLCLECVFDYLTCLVPYCCVSYLLHNCELHTSELLLSELSKLVALQEQLAGWLVDYVVS